MVSWYMSFTDPDKPEGNQFLGAVLADGPTMESVITETHLRGCNPGGQILVLGPFEESDMPNAWVDADRWVLMSRDDVETLDAKAPPQPEG